MSRAERARHRCLVGALAIALLVPAVPARADTAVGRHVTDLLREAQSAGLKIIYTDRTVPAHLRVTEEPRSHEPLERLREVLRSQGLKLDEVSTNVYVVSRSSRTAPVHVVEPTQEVHITASRYTIDPLADASFGLDSAQIERQPAMFDDATRSIRRFPGTAGQDLSSRTFVRGGTPDDNLLLLDGVPLYEPFHLPGLPINFSVIDPIAVGRVDFYSGVLPVAYGDRMGALLNMSLREPGPEFGGRLTVSTLAASAFVSGPLADDRGDWLAFGRRGLLGQFTRMDSPELGHPNLVDGLGRVRYRLDDAWLTVGGLAARDTAHVRFDDDTLFEDDTSARHYVWATYERTGERLSSRTLLSQTWLDTSRVGAVRDLVGSYGSLGDERHFTSTLLKQDWTLGSNPRNALRWGASLREDRARFSFNRLLSFDDEVARVFDRPTASISRFDDTVSLHQTAAYWQATRSLGTHLALDAGVRWSNARYSTAQTYSAWDPRLSVRLDLTPATRLRYAFGRMTQTWAAAELPVEQDRHTFDRPSINTMHVVAMEHDFGSRLSVRGELFSKRIAQPRPRAENAFFPNAFLPELRPDRLVIAPESSRMRGVDLYATATFTERLSAWLSYSRSVAQDMILGSGLVRAWDQPHAAGLGLTFAGHATQWTAELFAHRNWPLTPHIYQGSIVPGQEARNYLILTTRDPVGKGFYLSLNVKAEHVFDFESGSLHVALEASNATDRRNPCCDEVIFYPQNAFVTEGFEQRRWLPLTPYASFAWEF